jgi:hypothetical protein
MSLDPMTIERVAKLVCDPGGPYERRGRELESLLRRAAWVDPPEYDGSPRVLWLTEALEDRTGDQAAVERFLCRVCDPLEYADGMETANQICQALNQVLEPERLAVSYVSGRPVLGELRDDGAAASFGVPSDLDTRLRRLIDNDAATDQLLARVNETRICETNGAYVLAIIGIGSFVEGLLYFILNEQDEQFRTRGVVQRDGRWLPADRVPLQQLLSEAHDKGLIQMDAHKFAQNVREFRNYVHVRKQTEERATLDQDTVMMCWGPVLAVLNDLEVSMPIVRSASHEYLDYHNK